MEQKVKNEDAENIQKNIDGLVDGLESVISTTMGITRRLGSFTAVISEEMNVAIIADNGFIVSYPPVSDEWALLVSILKEWDEDSQKSLEVIIKGIIYPTATRFVGIDGEYIEDILSAHKRLTERMIAARDSENNDDEGNE